MRLIIVVDTQDPSVGGPDPLREDPHNIAEWVVDEFNSACTANGEHASTVSFISAEWAE